MHVTKTLLILGFAASAAFIVKAVPITPDELEVLMKGLQPMQPSEIATRELNVNLPREPKHHDEITLEELKNLNFDDSGALQEGSDKTNLNRRFNHIDISHLRFGDPVLSAVTGKSSDSSRKDRRFDFDRLKNTHFGSIASLAGGLKSGSLHVGKRSEGDNAPFRRPFNPSGIHFGSGALTSGKSSSTPDTEDLSTRSSGGFDDSELKHVQFGGSGEFAGLATGHGEFDFNHMRRDFFRGPADLNNLRFQTSALSDLFSPGPGGEPENKF